MQRTGHSRARAATLLTIATLLAVLLGGCIQVTLPMKESSAQKSAKGGKAPSTTTDNSPALPGTELTAGPWKAEVLRATRTKKGPGNAKPGAGKDWLLVDAVFRNIKMADALVLDLRHVSLADATGKSIPLAGNAPGYNGSGMRPISPGYGGGSVFAYRIPAGSAGYVWTFSPKVEGKERKLSWGVP